MIYEPIFFEPIFKERIWGGEQLKQFGYEIPYKQTGECWAFAAHENGQSVVKGGPFHGLTLGALWEQHRDLFGGIGGDRFPLLTKILDANDDLSVQVHPDDKYARVHENDLGKTECWYIIDCEPGAEIIYGHHAKTKQEFQTMVQEGKWNELLRKVPVKPGDFYYVPSGTIHAIGKGIMILETQQNSDTTYRVYDYDRRDAEGNFRELHIEKSIEVTNIPSSEAKLETDRKQIGDLAKTTYVESTYFTVSKWVMNGSAELHETEKFQLVSIISGEGTLEKEGKEFAYQKGDHFMLPAKFGGFILKGNAEMIVSHL